MNGGTCVDGVRSFTCKCIKGFYGDRCEQGQGQSILVSLLLIMFIRPKLNNNLSQLCSINFKGFSPDLDDDLCWGYFTTTDSHQVWFFLFLGFRPSPWWSQYIMNCYCLLHAFYFNRASNFVPLNSIACMCFIIIFIKHVDDVNRCLEAAEWISQGTLFQLLG